MTTTTALLVVTITDERTGRHVAANVAVDGLVAARNVIQVDLYVEVGVPHTLTVTARGYKPCSAHIDSHLRRYMRVDLSVRL